MSKEANIEFLASIIIPPGFVLIRNEELNDDLAFDQSSLVTNIVIESINCDMQGVCTATRNVAILTGVLRYNAVVGDFIAATPIDSITNNRRTKFASNGFVQINRTLACSFNDNRTSTDYWIDYLKGEDFVISKDGEKAYKIRDAHRYMQILNQPNHSKTINIPYVIQIHPGLRKE